MSGRFPQGGPQDTRRQKDSKLIKNEADDGFWLIDSETSDPFVAGSFSFEAGDPFQPLPWRAQQTKLEKPQQKHGRSENNDSETKPGANNDNETEPVAAMTYDALQSYSALNDNNKQSQGRKRSRSSSYEGTRILQNEGINRAAPAESAPIYNMSRSTRPVDHHSATRSHDRRLDASYSYASNINATHRHRDGRRPRYLEPGVAPRGMTPRDYSYQPDVENHHNFYPPMVPATADGYQHHQRHHHQQQQLPEASSPIMSEPQWIWHRSSEPIALPPPQYAPNTEQSYHLIYAAVTIPSEMASNFNTSSLYSAVREAVASADSTRGSNTPTEMSDANNDSNYERVFNTNKLRKK
mmetsp:Transcript_26564/g.38081  ORF Transcript_26564/g.38081 Transcript_26564/m.38081 type:complete len:353 (+) Transcript_26564:209-1267(+)|eukprot:CAMPEP_0172424108 /NCGR_PEP_ID=MMETSP1064-20121228/21243_1 /TAXON_ID=202472 /ORGANISM="Aulacoseira subarctica , Strain CCAP 1002/5" /LENGTH=352 /DNA_ID=CAMNT_0013165867 /DNA_START=147 /DNA_END=1205 /DNA_ORIENTATION=+